MARRLLSGLVSLALVWLCSAQEPYANRMALVNAPTSLPNTGSFSAVVEWETNIVGLVNLHLDLSDITQNYAFDGGATTQVRGPGYGVTTMQFTFNQVLNTGDRYHLHAYLTSQANSTLYGAGNEWRYSQFDSYTPVTVNANAIRNFMSIINPPNTLPRAGNILVDVAWSSNLPQCTILHADMSDITTQWAWDGGATANVTSPGTGVAQLNITILNAPLPLGDTYDLHIYFTSCANASAHPGQDWMYTAFDDTHTTVQVADLQSFANSVTVVNPPSVIPPSGNFTVQLAWSTNVTGQVNLHLDVSDVTQSYAYDGGAMIQVVGPSKGTTFITVAYSVAGPLNAADRYQLHAFMADEMTSLEYQNNGGLDWQHALANSYYDTKIGVPVVVNYPNALSMYQPPSTIPNSGTVNVVVEWSSNLPVSTTIHLDLSDITQNYAWDGGVSMTVSSPGSGFITLELPIIGTLNTGDAYQLHLYMASYANTTQYGAGNDWQHSSFDLYHRVVVSSSPLANTMSLLNLPTTIPTTGQIQLEVYYTSNLPNGTVLHVDLSDVTKNWLWETSAVMTVHSPGSGTVTMILNLPASLNLALGDTYNLHGYLTSLANSTLYGAANDWAHTAYDSYNTVTVANAASFPNSLAPVNAPATIPNSGSFSIQYAWSCNYTGEVNLHVDLSDLSQGWLYEGGATVQVTSPGSGLVTFLINLNAAIVIGDSYDLHAYITPTSAGLQYGPGNDWQHSIYDGFTPVQATLPTSGAIPNKLTFVNPPSLIPARDSFTVTVAWSSNIVGGAIVHIDLNDVTKAWEWETGAAARVASPGSGSLTLTLTLPAGLVLNSGDVYDLHAYMASVENATRYGNGSDWQHSATETFLQVAVMGGELQNTMTVINPPLTIANTGTETLQVLWTASTRGLMNLHCDISDVTLGYLYEGGSFVQVTGPGSGTVLMAIVMPTNPVAKIGDNYTVHCYMTGAANSSAAGGTANDWRVAAYEVQYPITVADISTFKTVMSIINPPTTIPASGSLTLKCAWSSSIPVESDLHLDLSDITLKYAWDGGSSTVVSSPGSGIVTLKLNIIGTLNPADEYQLHVYIASTANGTLYGEGNDWQHTAFDQYYRVRVEGSSSGAGDTSASSSGLSKGAIAGIVIGCVVGAGILLALCVAFMCMGGGRKGSKMDDTDKVTGAHSRHEDEQSQVSSADVEMGETHTRDE